MRTHTLVNPEYYLIGNGWLAEVLACHNLIIIYNYYIFKYTTMFPKFKWLLCLDINRKCSITSKANFPFVSFHIQCIFYHYLDIYFHKFILCKLHEKLLKPNGIFNKWGKRIIITKKKKLLIIYCNFRFIYSLGCPQLSIEYDVNIVSSIKICNVPIYQIKW